ncbi:hypothetical protein TWF696_009054 [Orbilia brochopaga]|uniref:Uncharacterized protein n=1 Tax=Orbilia brochopaga TaxID=3140254 RepID=A0AAV9UE48_9PEZI
MPCKPHAWPMLDWFQGKFEYAATEEENQRIRSIALQIIVTQNFVENDRMETSANYVERESSQAGPNTITRSTWSYP